MTTTTTKPQAIMFDLLTALLDSWEIWDVAVPPSEKHIADGQKWRKRYLELTYGCGSYVPYESLVAQAAQDVGLSAVAAANLRQNWDGITAWAEVPAILAKLKSSGVKLAAVTNCSNELGHRAINNLERLVRDTSGIQTFTFDVVVTAEESGFYKPDPKPYQDTLAKLKLDAQDVLFVAGSSADIPGATGVGMKVCWNNHVGLPRKNDILPWREGKTLDEALGKEILG